MNRISHNKILLLFMVLTLLCLSLCGCNKPSVDLPLAEETPTDTGIAAAQMTLAYTATDSLNPYLAKTKTNQELCGLLYDGLILLKEGYEVEYRLARDIVNEGTTVTVSLAQTTFSDGSPVTPQDVLTSMEAARTAENLSYGRDFENVKEITVNKNGLLEITLNHQDPYFVNFLDFPVYKSGTEQQENTDNKDLPPVGSGRYVFHEESGAYWLTANPNWMGGSVGISVIELKNLPDHDAIDHAVQVGTVDWCYSDLSNNNFPNMNGISKQVPLANLVYLGANMKLGYMSNQNIRAGVSAAINRSAVVDNAFFGVATPAAGPYLSSLKETVGLQTLPATADTQQAIACFTRAGFGSLDEEGRRINANGRLLSIKIIYNTENSARESMATLVAAQLGAVGCKATVSGLTYEEYRSAIRYGHYDLYIGEMVIPDNFDLYPLLTAGGMLTFDVSEPTVPETSSAEAGGDGADLGAVEENVEDAFIAARAAYRYHNGRGSLTEMVSCFNQELPIIPVCHRTGMLIYANSIKGEPAPLAGDPFNGIERCTVS